MYRGQHHREIECLRWRNRTEKKEHKTPKKSVVCQSGIHRLKLQSTLSKTDTFGTGAKCSPYRDVHLTWSQIKGVKKGKCRCFIEVSITR